MTQVTLQITQDNSINDTGTNYVRMGKNKIILLPHTIQDTVNKLLLSNYLPGTAFIIRHSTMIGTVFPFINILYPCLFPSPSLPPTLPPSVFEVLSHPSRWYLSFHCGFNLYTSSEQSSCNVNLISVSCFNDLYSLWNKINTPQHGMPRAFHLQLPNVSLKCVHKVLSILLFLSSLNTMFSSSLIPLHTHLCHFPGRVVPLHRALFPSRSFLHLYQAPSLPRGKQKLPLTFCTAFCHNT